MIFQDLVFGGGYLAAEFFALYTLVSAGVLLTITAVNWRARRHVFKSGRRLTKWTGMNFFAGLLSVVCLRLSDQFDPQDQSLIFGFRYATIELLLGLAFIMIFVSIAIRVVTQQQIP